MAQNILAGQLRNLLKKRMLAECFTELRQSKEQMKYSGNISDDYYKLQGKNEADRIKIRQMLEKADISAKDYTFRANGQSLKFDGFLKVYPTKLITKE